MQIYVHRNNQQLGPFTEAEIKAQLASGAISLQDNVWWEGQANWVPLGASPLVSTLSPATPPVPRPGTPGVPGLNAAAPATSQLAIWSLVCGCLSLLCGILTAIPAIILGHLGLSEIRKNPNLQGRGMALAGLIIGYVMIVIVIVITSIYLTLLPAILKAAKNAQTSQQLFPFNNFTNSTDQTTNNSDQTTTSPDQSTNDTSSATNSADSSTNSAPAVTP